MNVSNVTKIAKCVALIAVGIMTGGSVVAVADHSKVSRYKKVTKRAQDTCEKALHVAEEAVKRSNKHNETE